MSPLAKPVIGFNVTLTWLQLLGSLGGLISCCSVVTPVSAPFSVEEAHAEGEGRPDTVNHAGRTKESEEGSFPALRHVETRFPLRNVLLRW